MSISDPAIKTEARALDVQVTDDALEVTLVDGRRISAPLEWFPNLRQATPAQRNRWRLIGPGIGILPIALAIA